jgi:hypothetical protein
MIFPTLVSAEASDIIESYLIDLAAQRLLNDVELRRDLPIDGVYLEQRPSLFAPKGRFLTSDRNVANTRPSPLTLRC